MGMTVHDFWGRPDDIWTGLTVREFVAEADAFRVREERTQDLVFAHAVNLMNMWSKKAIKLEQLTGRRRKPKKKAEDEKPNFAGKSPDEYRAWQEEQRAKSEGDYITALVEDTEIDPLPWYDDDEEGEEIGEDLIAAFDEPGDTLPDGGPS